MKFSSKKLLVAATVGDSLTSVPTSYTYASGSHTAMRKKQIATRKATTQTTQPLRQR